MSRTTSGGLHRSPKMQFDAACHGEHKLLAFVTTFTAAPWVWVRVTHSHSFWTKYIITTVHQKVNALVFSVKKKGSRKSYVSQATQGKGIALRSHTRLGSRFPSIVLVHYSHLH